MPDKVFKDRCGIVEIVNEKKIICVTDLFIDIIGKRTFKQTVEGIFAFVNLYPVKHFDKEFEFGF